MIINPGYGEETTAYSFIAKKFVSECYLVISIGHELPTDEPLAREGNLYKLRLPVWERGVKNIQFVLKETNNIEKRIILIGHSNGGDISMLYANYQLIKCRIYSYACAVFIPMATGLSYNLNT